MYVLDALKWNWKINMYRRKSLENDEQRFLINMLVGQTVFGKIQWIYTEYNPISLTYRIKIPLFNFRMTLYSPIRYNVD